MARNKLRAIIIVLLSLLSLGALLLWLLLSGIIIPNAKAAESYPVRGVDVSSYQGDIDWPALAAQNIQFAFIKATEGSGHVDERFAANWEQAQQTNLRVGAYHFFSYDSPGQTQADNFIKAVPLQPGALPPVVDVEFYGDKERNLPDATETVTQLTVMLEQLEQQYGQKPILYATEKSYRLFLAEDFDAYDIWIRSVWNAPSLLHDRDWTLWQYTDRAQLQGYNGKENFIDLNVFAGTQAEWDSYQK